MITYRELHVLIEKMSEEDKDAWAMVLLEDEDHEDGGDTFYIGGVEIKQMKCTSAGIEDERPVPYMIIPEGPVGPPC